MYLSVLQYYLVEFLSSTDYEQLKEKDQDLFFSFCCSFFFFSHFPCSLLNAKYLTQCLTQGPRSLNVTWMAEQNFKANFRKLPFQGQGGSLELLLQILFSISTIAWNSLLFYFSITKEFIHGILRIPIGKTQIWETPKECLGEEKELGAYKRKSHRVVKSCLVMK